MNHSSILKNHSAPVVKKCNRKKEAVEEMKGKVIYTMAPVKIVEVRLNIFLTGIKAAILFVPNVRSTTLLPPISRASTQNNPASMSENKRF